MMNEERRKRLEAIGWRFGSVEDFLGGDISVEGKMHRAGSCPKDPKRCYVCHVEQLEAESRRARIEEKQK